MQKERQSSILAKNSILLYIRMIIITIISLYTSRVILKLLGLNDFGIFNVVAGIIEFASIFTTTMTSATQRFLSFDLGKNNLVGFNKTFCSLFNIFIAFCAIFFIVSLPIGLWMIDGLLDIPIERIHAASWVFVCALVAFELNTLVTPYMSSIIAYERMGAYTFFSVTETVLKLLATLILFYYDGDRLIAFSISTIIIRLSLNTAIVVYCRENLAGCRFRIFWDWPYIKQLASFSGWTLIGSTSFVLMTQGHSILLNVFFGPLINAAKGIADRIKNFSLMFSQNILLAITPQLTKSYAAGDMSYLHSIIYASSRLSFMLLMIVSFPIIMEMRTILEVWLGADNVTDETTSFSLFSLAFVFVSTIEAPLTKTVQASGNVRDYELYTGFSTLLFIPFSYLLLKIGLKADYTYVCMIAINFIVLGYRTYCVKKIGNICYKDYFCQVVLPILKVCLVLSVITFLITTYLNKDTAVILRLVGEGAMVCLVVWLLGITSQEKQFCISKLKGLYRS